MPGWLKTILGIAARVVPGAITDLIGLTVGGIASVLGGLTGNVADSWRELAIGMDAHRAGTASFADDLLTTMGKIIGHWIPRYAITAWWWVTHPEQLAEQLVLYVVRQLEVRAWQLAPYLGRFVLALLVHNVRRVALLAEAILTAIL